MSGESTTSIAAAWWIATIVPLGLVAMYLFLAAATRRPAPACPARLERERREAVLAAREDSVRGVTAHARPGHDAGSDTVEPARAA